MPNADQTITAEFNLSALIEFTRTSPAFTPKIRLNALIDLLQGCTLAINTCHTGYAAALGKIFESHGIKELLNKMSELSPKDLQIWISMTNRVFNESMLELKQIRKESYALKECKGKAEEAGKELD